MAAKVHLDVPLTLLEAKAIARLVKIGISALEIDNTQVSNPVILRRAIKASKSGLERIESAIVHLDPLYRSANDDSLDMT